MILIVMGVSGAGKTLIGELLAQRLACSFVDGDEFHSAANKEKMAQGIALTDDDRWPWLAAIRAAIEARVQAGQSLIVGCSALKRVYRDVLRGGAQGDGIVRFVYLKGSFELLHERLATRGRHFFNPALLQSQLDTLEEPGDDEAVTVSIELSPDAIVDQVIASLG
ncbi:MAG: gluconokinase [Trinickia sp.]|jgi:gluconokinase